MKKKIRAHVAKINPRHREPEVLKPVRVTNDTIAEHREEVLGKARKYIYPLRHSKNRLVQISLSLFVVAVVVFFSYCIVALYKFKSNSTFLYKVTQVIPFPVARTGSHFVSYESYYFEVNHYIHYYQTQQGLDINSDAGKEQIAEYKKKALDKVIDDAYIKEVAKEKGITVSDREVNDRIASVRAQNRLGANDKEFRSVLKDFWNWSEADFKRSLKMQILSEKVNSALDTQTHDRANAAKTRLNQGQDFSQVAKEVSDDPFAKQSGGDYGILIDKTNRDIDPRVIDALYKLQEGQVSDVIDVGYGLEIVKKVQNQPDDKVRAAHITFTFKNINDYLNDIKDKQKTRTYVRF